MKIFYITLNSDIEASKISHHLLSNQLAVCTNWFDINCAYRIDNEIKQDKEVVLIVKTQHGMREAIENGVRQFINYTNFIAEMSVDSVNSSFMQWLNEAVPKSNAGNQ